MNTKSIKTNNDIIGLALIPFTALCVVTLLYLFLPVTFELATLLQVGQGSISQLTTCFGLFYAFGFLIWGPLSDKFGRGNIILFGLISLSIITFMLPLYVNYGYLFVLRCVQGFFAASFPPVILAWLAENLSDKPKKRAISLISCAFLLAATLGQWYGAEMIKTSISSAMFILAIVFLLSGLLFYGATRNTWHHANSNNGSLQSISLNRVFIQLPQVLFDKKLIRIYCSALFVLMSFVSLYILLNSFKDNSHIDINILRKVSAFGMAFSLLSSWLFSKMSVTKVLAMALIMMSLTLILQLFIIYKISMFSMLLPFIHFLFVICIAFAIPSMITVITTYSEQHNRGVAVALYTCILFIGASLGSLLPNYLNIYSLIVVISFILFIVASSVCVLKLAN